jgi:hypothetical protein
MIVDRTTFAKRCLEWQVQAKALGVPEAWPQVLLRGLVYLTKTKNCLIMSIDHLVGDGDVFDAASIRGPPAVQSFESYICLWL